MSTKSIITETYDIWRKNWLNDITIFGILAFIGLIFILPLAMTLGYEGDTISLNVLVFISALISLILTVHISFVVATIQVLDEYAEKNENITLTESLVAVFSKGRDLLITSGFYLVLLGLPASLMYYYLIDFYLDYFWLQVLLVGLILVAMIVVGTPWFVGIGFIMNDDMDAVSSIKKSWNMMNQRLNEIIAPAFVAVAPVILVGLGVVILGLTMPSGAMFVVWSALIFVLLTFTGVVLLPWSLNITYPLFEKLEN